MAKLADFKKVVASMRTMTPAQTKKFSQEWAKWAKKKGMSDGGAPLGKNMRVWRKKVSDMRNEVGGYSIIKANSLGEAAKKMQSNPHFKMIPRGWIDVMEILPM